jgi:uncharacterized repeat protein (TIGR03803 family)
MKMTYRILWISVYLVGTVYFSFGTTETTLHNFTGGTDGFNPLGDLLYDPQTGFLLGTTNKGGGSAACPQGCGTVFAIRPDGTGYRILYHFLGGADGANPQAGLVMDANRNLYGTTYNGGTHNLGSVFKLHPGANGHFTETVLLSFPGGAGGAHPRSKLVLDASRNLYGTTFAGGTNGLGIVFRVAPAGTETVIHRFTGGNGSHPQAGVVFDAAGNLWGTTSAGGALNLGTVFQLSPSGADWTQSFLYSFRGTNDADGANPAAAVTIDANGNVFGTTRFGGSPACTFAAAGCGVVFELQPSGQSFAESVTYNFTGGLDGAAPIGDLTVALDASLHQYIYGTASQAGTIGGTCPAAGCGVAFELCGVGSSCQSGVDLWTEYTLFDFAGAVGGRTPSANMIVFSPVGVESEHPDFPTGGRGGCTSGCATTTGNGGSSGGGTTSELND